MLRVRGADILPGVEAHEALVAGLLGLAVLHAHSRKRDPGDRILAAVLFWICLSGVLGLLLAQVDGAVWRYVRVALRLTGPALLLVTCEESVRTKDYGGSRRNSLLFAAVVWGLALFGLFYRHGRALADVSLERIGYPLQMGVTVWMAILAITTIGALLAIVPAAFRRISPGLAGGVALLLLASESWAALDTRWSTGMVGPVSLRSLFTVALALVALAKARSPGLGVLMSAASVEPERPRKKAARTGSSRPGSEEEESPSEQEPEGDAAEESPPVAETKPEGSQRSPRRSGAKSGKKRRR